MVQKLIGASLVASVLVLAAGPVLAQTDEFIIPPNPSIHKGTTSTKQFRERGSSTSTRSTSTSSTRPSGEKNPQVNPQTAACIKTAISARDDALGAAVGTHATALESALQARKTALLAAWDKSDSKERKAAIKAAWDAFRASKKSARTAFRSAQHAAWTKFRSDRKACKGTAALDDKTTESVDNQ